MTRRNSPRDHVVEELHLDTSCGRVADTNVEENDGAGHVDRERDEAMRLMREANARRAGLVKCVVVA